MWRLQFDLESRWGKFQFCMQGKKNYNTNNNKYSRWKVQNINNRPYLSRHLEVAEYVQLYKFINAGRNFRSSLVTLLMCYDKASQLSTPLYTAVFTAGRARKLLSGFCNRHHQVPYIPSIPNCRRPLSDTRILLLRTTEHWIIRHEGSTLPGKRRNRIWRSGPRLQIRGSFLLKLVGKWGNWRKE